MVAMRCPTPRMVVGIWAPYKGSAFRTRSAATRGLPGEQGRQIGQGGDPPVGVSEDTGAVGPQMRPRPAPKVRRVESGRRGRAYVVGRVVADVDRLLGCRLPCLDCPAE